MSSHPEGVARRSTRLLLAAVCLVSVANAKAATTAARAEADTVRRVSALLEAPLVEPGGRTVGRVHDVLIAQGRLTTVIIERAGDARVFTRIAFSNVGFDPSRGALILNSAVRGLSTLPRYQAPPAPNATETSVKQLLGLPVSFERSPRAAELVDLLYKTRSEQLMAFVITSPQGGETHYAVPWARARIQRARELVFFPTTIASITAEGGEAYPIEPAPAAAARADAKR